MTPTPNHTHGRKRLQRGLRLSHGLSTIETMWRNGFLCIALLLGCTPSGETCGDSECASGEVCVSARCLSLKSDPDGDGLLSEVELKWGLNPLGRDSDGDGIPDGQEWGEGEVGADSDGDGVPDALESALWDADGDCIPDQEDKHNNSMDSLSSVVGVYCPNTGVCTVESAVRVECLGGVPVCRFDAVESFEEEETWCDGLDNDCDGETDEGSTFAGAKPGEECLAPGECGVGVVECDDEGKAVCSSGPGGSENKAVEELCDLLDNDCDGETDEGLSWEGIPLGEECDGTGACGIGVVECRVDLGSAICSTMFKGSADETEPEECDGIDNDCDGMTDEDLFSLDLSDCPQEGVCGKARQELKMVCEGGVWTCDLSSVPGYTEGHEEACDGEDNDCDGLTDEDFLLVDFDGSKKGVNAECGTGPCAGGKVVCSNDGTSVECSTWVNMSVEVCDGIDNDCDGQVDEGMEYQGAPLGAPCKGIGVCGPGTVECSNVTGAATCSTNPDGSTPGSGEEICDLLDNDCDGETDEGIVEVPACPTSGVCEGMNPVVECISGTWVCNFSANPDWEEVESLCDGLDNDCDGWVDESALKEFADGKIISTTGFPPARTGAASLFVPEDGGIFLAGGLAHPFPWQGKELCIFDLFRLDPASGEWSQLPSGPVSGRWGHAMAYSAATKSLVIVGGRCGEELSSSSWRYSLDDGSFENLAVPDIVSERYGHAMFFDSKSGSMLVIGGMAGGDFLDSYIIDSNLETVEKVTGAPRMAFSGWCSNTLVNAGYMFGGIGEDGSPTSDFLVVDPVQGTVAPVPKTVPWPAARSRASLTCRNDAVVLFGGEDAEGNLLGDTWIYDPLGGHWKMGPAGPPARKEALVAWDSEGTVLWGGVGAQGEMLHDWWRLGDESWVDNTVSQPGNLSAAAYALDPVGKRICLAGGFEGGIGRQIPRNDLWCMDLAGGSWKKMGSGLEEPSVFATMSFDPNTNRLLLIGGAAFPDGKEPQPLSPLCRYSAFDFVTLSWSDFYPCDESGPAAISSHAVAVRWKDLSLWIYGGIRSSGMSGDLWKLHLDTLEWEKVLLNPPLPPNYGHRMVVREEQGDLIVVGGMAGQGSLVLIDPNAGTWSILVAAEWLKGGFPGFFFDHSSDIALLLQSSKPGGTQLELKGSQLSGLKLLAFPSEYVPVTLGASFLDPWRRRGLLFGGVDAAGLTRGGLVIFEMSCQ